MADLPTEPEEHHSSIGGRAGMTGLNTIFVDDRDPFAHGS
nr:proline racemase family protein [Mesorhizobium kowhaii]